MLVNCTMCCGTFCVMKNDLRKKPSVLDWWMSFYGLDKMGPLSAALFVFVVLVGMAFWVIMVLGYIESFIPEERKQWFAPWLLATSGLGLIYCIGAMRHIRDRDFKDDDC